MKNIVIVDLDGTLYNSARRNHLAEAKLWDDFHMQSRDDEPNWDVLRLLQILNPDVQVWAITGRNEKFRDITNEWLQKYDVPIDMLFMRNDGDWRSDADIKIEKLEELFGSRLAVLDAVICVLEDRDKMVEAYRNYGLPCWQVRNGSY